MTFGRRMRGTVTAWDVGREHGRIRPDAGAILRVSFFSLPHGRGNLIPGERVSFLAVAAPGGAWDATDAKLDPTTQKVVGLLRDRRLRGDERLIGLAGLRDAGIATPAEISHPLSIGGRVG